MICRPWAFADEGEDADMLEMGWLLLDHQYKGRECWYQSRSTRIDLASYVPRFRHHNHNGQQVKVKHIIPGSEDDLKLVGIQTVYKHYIKRKKFKDLYDPLSYVCPRTSFLLFYLGDELVGFTKMRQYHWHEELLDASDNILFPEISGRGSSPGMESVLHASTVPISAITADLEIQWARDNGAHTYYMGSGYERGSEYKASYKGFEWWTGEVWSTQKKTYRRLCKRDSDIELIRDLRNAK